MSAGSGPDNEIQRLAQRSFNQLRGTVQDQVLLHALMKDRAIKHLSDDSQDEGEDEDEDEEDALLDQRRLEIVQQLLGARGRGRRGGRGGRGRGKIAAAGWGLHLLGVWAAAGGARLPRARVAWTPPRGVAEALVSWSVPGLRISGSRIVSGVSQAEVPLVEQHATRVTVSSRGLQCFNQAESYVPRQAALARCGSQSNPRSLSAE